MNNTTGEEIQLSRLTELAGNTDTKGFEQEWEKAVKANLPVDELLEALKVFKNTNKEMALDLAELAAENYDSAGSERTGDFCGGAALLFKRSTTIASILAESLRDKHLMFEPLEAFISASGLLGTKKDLPDSWTKLRDLLLYTQGSFILHKEFGPGEILRVSRTSFTVDFQRSRDHDLTIDALLDSTRPIGQKSLYVLRWKKPSDFEAAIQTGGEILLKKTFEDMAVNNALTEVNLFKLLEGADIKPRTMWKALKKAAEESNGFILMGDSIIPADNSSLTSQVKAVLAIKSLPMSEKTKTVNALIKASSAGQVRELDEIFEDVSRIKDIEKGAVFELAWLCSNRGKTEDFKDRTEQLIEKKAVRVERAMGEIHSVSCKKLYLQRFFQSSPEPTEATTLVHRLPRTLREQAADHIAELNPEVHAEYILGALDNPGETEHFMWALERAAVLEDFMEPDTIVTLALKNLNFARSDMQRRVCNLLMDNLRPQLEQHISLLDTRRLETLTGNLEESIGAQESGLVLLARRELSGRRTGGFTNIKKFWEGETTFSSREGIARRVQELENLQLEKIPAAAKDIAEAASHGDLSENAEYTAALEKRDFLLETLNRFRKELKLLQPYPVGLVSADTVCPATKVVLESMGSEASIRTLCIVGPLDSDTDAGLINYKAPLGAALLGLTKGDTVQLPGERNLKWRITEITVLEEFL